MVSSKSYEGVYLSELDRGPLLSVKQAGLAISLEG